MILADSSALSSWELWGVVGLFAVIAGCIGEGMAEFTRIPKDDGRRHKMGRFCWFMLVAGLAVELICIFPAAFVKDLEIARLAFEAANAGSRIAGARLQAVRAQAEGEKARREAALARQAAAEADARAMEAKTRGEAIHLEAAKANERAEEANRRAKELENANLAMQEEMAKANHAAAVAQMQAVDAQRKLEEFRRPRAFDFDAAKRARVIERMKQFAGQKFDVGIPAGDAEAELLMGDIQDILEKAGWQQVDWPRIEGSVWVVAKDGKRRVGQASAMYMSILADRDKYPLAYKAAFEFAIALMTEGVGAVPNPTEGNSQWNTGVVHVLIGRKN